MLERRHGEAPHHQGEICSSPKEPYPAPGEPSPPPAHTATLTASPDWKREELSFDSKLGFAKVAYAGQGILTQSIPSLIQTYQQGWTTLKTQVFLFRTG